MAGKLDDGALERTRLSVGFVPLTDCAVLAVAQELGLFAKHGLQVSLSREASWANIRDKVAMDVLDGAQMLAPMPIAATLGMGAVSKPTISAFSMGLNGNAVTVAHDLYARMQDLHPDGVIHGATAAAALRRVIDADQAAGRPPLTFATVFPYSSHNYQLRYWMASAGIDPDRDVRLVVIPPPQMVTSLQTDQVVGYCVGEPWNALAVQAGIGRTIITSHEIWNNNPEKVYGVNLDWAIRYPHTHQAVLRALLEAARWLDEPDNRREAAELIAGPDYLGAPVEVVRMSMTGTFRYASDEAPRPLPDFNVFHRYAANFPWLSHAEWLITQMYRWGQLGAPVDIRRAAAQVYRPELYREAAAAVGVVCPGVLRKTEGTHAGGWLLTEAGEQIPMGPDKFIDGRVFDPADLMGYLRGFDVSHSRIPLHQLAPLNA
jgi:ABC-type nitrate/sulfonate/bicarbonate transport system substrate-binding protein